jgi:hypothetical protein
VSLREELKMSISYFPSSCTNLSITFFHAPNSGQLSQQSVGVTIKHTFIIGLLDPMRSSDTENIFILFLYFNVYLRHDLHLKLAPYTNCPRCSEIPVEKVIFWYPNFVTELLGTATGYIIPVEPGEMTSEDLGGM